MRLQRGGPGIRTGVTTALFVIAAAGFAWSGGAGRSAAPAPPAPQATPAPQPSSAPAASPSPPEGTAAAAEELPRIVRTVCTDHVCGGCDGKCRKSTGHVAIDKKGHCACTPTEGSALDRAIRAAYERRPSQ
jgi:hypothetical protein